MIPYAVYKVAHYLGLFALFVTLSAALARSAALPPGTEDPWRKRLSALHGISMLVVLIAGFGLMARLGIMHGALFPGWIWAKLVLWALLGALLGLAIRRSRWTGPALVILPFVAALAGFLALIKPF